MNTLAGHLSKGLLATCLLTLGGVATAQTVAGSGIAPDPNLMKVTTGRASCSFEGKIPTPDGEITSYGVTTSMLDGGGTTGGVGTFTSGRFTVTINTSPAVTCDFHLDNTKASDNKYVVGSNGTGFQTINWVADSPACQAGGAIPNLANYRDQMRTQMSFKTSGSVVTVNRVSMLRYIDSANPNDTVMLGECH